MPTHHIALDIGGTQLRAAVFPAGINTPSRVVKIPTQQRGETPLDRLLGLIAAIWPSEDAVAGIGVAIPGPVDPYRGVVRTCPNIPGWDDLALRWILHERFGVPAAIGNDANMAAMGEWKLGAGQGHHNLLYLTVSTGIGGGVVVQDQLLQGAHGLAAELGHVTVLLDGPLCGCGQRGHLEAVAAGPAIARWVEQELDQGVPSILAEKRPLNARLVAQAAKQGDELAMAALARSGSYIGVALADFMHIFNPSIVIIGGGVSQSGNLILDPMRQALREHVLNPHYLEDLVITTAALGDEAGLMGALALARQISET